MLHRTRENCDSKVILPVIAMEEKVEAFVVAGAIFFGQIGSQMCKAIFRDWRPGLRATLTSALCKDVLCPLNFPDFGGASVYNREKCNVYLRRTLF